MARCFALLLIGTGTFLANFAQADCDWASLAIGEAQQFAKRFDYSVRNPRTALLAYSQTERGMISAYNIAVVFEGVPSDEEPVQEFIEVVKISPNDCKVLNSYHSPLVLPNKWGR